MKLEIYFKSDDDYPGVVDHNFEIAGPLGPYNNWYDRLNNSNYKFFNAWKEMFKKLVIYED